MGIEAADAVNAADAAEAEAIRRKAHEARMLKAHDSRHRVEILHGEPLEDRKSVFQAHLARVKNADQVDWVWWQLQSDRKISSATHNIVAYVFKDESRGILVADSFDDGEAAAGGHLAELLRLRGVDGVFLMVSRWFGGTHLGSDRFKDIKRVAGAVLDTAGLSKHAGTGNASTKSSRKN